MIEMREDDDVDFWQVVIGGVAAVGAGVATAFSVGMRAIGTLGLACPPSSPLLVAGRIATVFGLQIAVVAFFLAVEARVAAKTIFPLAVGTATIAKRQISVIALFRALHETVAAMTRLGMQRAPALVANALGCLDTASRGATVTDNAIGIVAGLSWFESTVATGS